MITLEDVCLSVRVGFMRRKKQILNKVTFSVPADAIVGYLGINGAGKTTTIKLISGINSPDSGTVLVEGQSPQLSETRQKLGYLPENPYFYEYLTPREALDFYGGLHGLTTAERSQRADELLERVDLKDDADRPVRGFSKGMRQRLGLAQALIQDPKLLILDEPLTGLDPMGRLLLREIIVNERKRGRTIFFSSHVLSDVEAICDNLVILDQGRIAYQGTLESLKDEYVARDVSLHFRASEAELEQCHEDMKEAALSWSQAPVLRAGVYEAQLASEDDSQRFIDILRKHGGRLLELKTAGLSLEDYFLKRFGGPNKNTDKDADEKADDAG